MTEKLSHPYTCCVNGKDVKFIFDGLQSKVKKRQDGKNAYDLTFSIETEEELSGYEREVLSRIEVFKNVLINGKEQ